MKLPLFSFQPSLPIQTRYLDAFAGIVTVSVGHCHPRVLRAIQDQQVRRFFLLFFLRGSFSFFQRSSSSSFFRSSKFKKKNEKNSKKQQNRLQHTTTIYLHPEVALFAQELTSRLPPGLDVAYFTNSGTEANDLAILLARAFTRNYDLLALRHAYHGGGGSPYGATAHSTWRHAVPAGFGVRHVACPDAYRGIFSSESGDDDGSSDKNGGGGDDENAIGLKYARELQETIDTCTPGRVAGFLHESIQGVGGVRRRKKRERERERESFWFFLSSLFCAGKKKQGTKEEEKERLTFFPPLSLSLLFLKNKTGRPPRQGLPEASLRGRARSGGPLHRRRGPDGVREDREALLGLRGPRRRAGHSDDGQGDRQRAAPGRGGDDEGGRCVPCGEASL